MLYHVSPTPNLAVLSPRVSTHGKAYVYAVDQLTTGLLFGAKHDDFDFRLSTNDDGTPELYECYPDAFRSVYEGKRCSVYELKDDGFQRGMTSWEPELVCESEVAVVKETVIDDLYARLMQEAADGRLILRPFANTPEYKRLISAHIVDRLIRFDALRCLDTDPRFQRYFRAIIEALNDILDGHLLNEFDRRFES